MAALLADIPVPVKQNVVSTVNLDCKLDLKLIALQARNAEYNPRRFGAVIMRIKDPKTTALIFSSGKMVVTGAKSEGLSKIAARRFTKIVEKLGFPVNLNNFKIQNIVASCDVGFRIGLEALNYSQGMYAKYEPELFPGLVYKVVEPKVSMLVFASGKVVITGAKNYRDTLTAWEKVYPIMRQHMSSKKELIRGPAKR